MADSEQKQMERIDHLLFGIIVVRWADGGGIDEVG